MKTASASAIPGHPPLQIRVQHDLLEQLLHPAPPARRKPTIVLKDVRLFLNTVSRGLSLMKQAGVKANCLRQETADTIQLTITIPK